MPLASPSASWPYRSTQLADLLGTPVQLVVSRGRTAWATVCLFPIVAHYWMCSPVTAGEFFCPGATRSTRIPASAGSTRCFRKGCPVPANRTCTAAPSLLSRHLGVAVVAAASHIAPVCLEQAVDDRRQEILPGAARAEIAKIRERAAEAAPFLLASTRYRSSVVGRRPAQSCNQEPHDLRPERAHVSGKRVVLRGEHCHFVFEFGLFCVQAFVFRGQRLNPRQQRVEHVCGFHNASPASSRSVPQNSVTAASAARSEACRRSRCTAAAKRSARADVIGVLIAINDISVSLVVRPAIGCAALWSAAYPGSSRNL
jgi:hypothetical protein